MNFLTTILQYLSKKIRKDKIKFKIRITIENLSIFVDKIQSKYTNAANFTPNIKINDLNSSNASILQNQIVNSIYPYPYSSIWQRSRSHRKLVYFRSRGIYPHQKKKKKTFINHKINILPHMYVIFHDLKNNLQLVSPHFFLSVKKNKIYLPSPESTSSDLSLSLSLSRITSPLSTATVYTRVYIARGFARYRSESRGWRSKSVWSQKIGGETPG